VTNATCTGLSNSYTLTVSPSQPLQAGPGSTTFTITGLNVGLWVHHISVSVSSNNTYDQYQKGMVLEAPTASTTAVSWTYFPTSIKVFTGGDAVGGTCGVSCTLRQALATAPGKTTPVLIWFTVSPGAMTQTADLQVGSVDGKVTVDGTNSSGNPWIVGDALATQDPFPTVVDLANVTSFRVVGPNNTIKGLSISNTVPAGQTPRPLIYDPFGSTNTTIQNTRLDGGAAGLSCGGCSPVSYLASVTETGLKISNVEGRSAYGYGVWLSAADPPVANITDSWFHHNFNDNLYVTDAMLSRNMVELAGFRASDNTVVYGSANGIHGNAVSNIATSRNVVRENARSGIEVTATSITPSLSLAHDYVCGNGSLYGILVWGGANGVANGTGLTAAYNSYYGLYLDSSILPGSTLAFNGDSAFTSNVTAGFVNASSVTASAINNQWRGVTSGCHSSPDVSGPITCDPVQDYGSTPVAIALDHPTVPSNALMRGQTIRVQGTGFNAIDGNPLAGSTCSLGPNPNSNPTNCCRMTTKANTCTATSPPQGLVNQGNCTAFKNLVGNWVVSRPTSVTPTTIVTSPNNNIACIGNYNEQVLVSKIDALGNNLWSQRPYCTNVDPK
jgi:hypothetical protein